MLIELQRTQRMSDRVLGVMRINDIPLCDTLEPVNCIPAGMYTIRVTWSPKYQRYMPEILNVPGRKGIRIHSGNFPQHTQGCVLLGVSDGLNLTRSRATVADFEDKLRKIKTPNDEEIRICVSDPTADELQERSADNQYTEE